jgi:hypothetical protein
MADQTQSYSSHRRFIPLWHFVALPIVLGGVLVEADRMYKYGIHKGTAWDLIYAIGVLLAVFYSRVMAMTVQDRVIRLEMRLRLSGVLPDSLKARVNDLTPKQLVGLRFASDAELPGLVEQCLSGSLKDGEAVKKQIKTWVPDFLRG